MYMVADSFNYYVSAIYFVALVLVCSFFLLNLTVAVMSDNFDKLRSEEKENEENDND